MLSRQNATQIAIIIIGMFGTSLGTVGLPNSAYASEPLRLTASETTDSSSDEFLESTEVQQNIEATYTEEKNTEGEAQEENVASEHRVLEHQVLEHQSVDNWILDRPNGEEQTQAEQKEAAIAQVIEAIVIDTATAPSSTVQLREQLLAYANSEHHPSHSETSKTAPTAATLGGPVNLNATAAPFTEPTSTLSLAAVSSAFSVEPTSVPALQAALNSSNELTRLYAADTLWTLTGEADLVLPTLLAAADSQNVETRELALSAIAQLGQAALPAVPVLNDIIQNSDYLTDNKTRQIAQDVLNVVSSENRPAAMLGILAREVQRRGGIPILLRTLSRLW